MFNPPKFPQDSGSYIDLLKRISQGVQQEKIDEQILEIMQKGFEKELNKNRIVLSRAERVRLLQQVSKVILTSMLTKIDQGE